LAVRALDPSAQIDDVAAEALVRGHLDHEPLEPDRVIGVDRPSEADPELEPTIDLCRE
jgi:hypothetical protein